MDELPTAVDEFIEAVTRLKQDSDRKEAQHKKEEQEWRRQGEGLVDKMEKMRKETFAQKNKLADQTRALKALQGQIASLELSLNDSEDLLKKAQFEDERKGLIITDVRDDLTEATNKVSKATETINALKEENALLTNKLNEKSGAVTRLMTTNTALDEEQKELRLAHDSEIEMHKKANKKLQQRLTQMTQDIETLSQKIEDQKTEISDAKESAKEARAGQNAANGQVKNLGDEIEKLKLQIQALIAENEKHQKDLKECLEHKKTLTNKAKALEVEVKKYKKQKRALDKIKDTDEFAPKNPTRRNPTRRKSIRAPRVRPIAPRVRPMVLTHEQIREKIQALQNQQRQQVNDRRRKAYLEIKSNRTSEEVKELEQIKSRLKYAKVFDNQIKDLEEQDKDLNFIDDEIEKIKISLENTRERWAKFQDEEDFQNFIQNIKSYEYNKRDGVEIDSPRLKKLDKALEKLEMKEAPKFFQEVIDGKFDKLLGEVTGTSQKTGNPQGPIKRNNPDFQIRLRF